MNLWIILGILTVILAMAGVVGLLVFAFKKSSAISKKLWFRLLAVIFSIAILFLIAMPVQSMAAYWSQSVGLLPGSAVVFASDSPATDRYMAGVAKSFYGARVQICDGTADEAQWNAAITALASTTEGGEIHGTAGNFTLANEIDFAPAAGKAVIISGEGWLATQFNQSASVDAFFYSTVAHNGITIKDLYIYGSKATLTAIGIDATNCQGMKTENVFVDSVSSHGFKNVNYPYSCKAESCGGSGFYNDTWGLVGINLRAASCTQYGFRPYHDSRLTNIDSIENGIGIYLANGVFPIFLNGVEVTMSDTVPSTVGIELAGALAPVMSNVVIDIGIDAVSGIKTTGNTLGVQLSNITVRGRTGGSYANQVLLNFANAFNRSTLNGFTLVNTGGIGLKLDVGGNYGNAVQAQFINGQMNAVATPISVASGRVGIEYILSDIHTNDSTLEKFYNTDRYHLVTEITKTGSTLTNGTGTFTGSVIALKPGANTVACTVAGTATIVLPTGSTGTAATGTMTVDSSPVALVGGSNVITTSGATGNITVTINAIAFAIPCPSAQACLIEKVEVDITTAGGTATSTIKVGMADNAVGLNLGAELFTAINANSAVITDSYLAGDTGAQTKWIPWAASGADSYLLAIFETEIANNLVGKVHITYVSR